MDVTGRRYHFGQWASLLSMGFAIVSIVVPIVAFGAFYQPVRADTTQAAFAEIPKAGLVVALLGIPFALIALLRSRAKRPSAWIALGFTLIASAMAWPWSHIVGVVLRWRQ